MKHREADANSLSHLQKVAFAKEGQRRYAHWWGSSSDPAMPGVF